MTPVPDVSPHPCTIASLPQTSDGNIPSLGQGPGSNPLLRPCAGQLVAVAVVDILPESLSSKYFFWDPGHAGLSPGRLSALLEIEHVRAAGAACPGLRYYMMGFYIATCSKMSYKARPILQVVLELTQALPTPLASPQPTLMRHACTTLQHHLTEMRPHTGQPCQPCATLGVTQRHALLRAGTRFDCAMPAHVFAGGVPPVRAAVPHGAVLGARGKMLGGTGERQLRRAQRPARSAGGPRSRAGICQSAG